MRVRFSTILVLVTLTFSGLSFAAPKNLCDDPNKVHELEATTTGEVIEGPACVKVSVNALRYSPALVKTITLSAGPDLTGVFPKVAEPSGGGNCRVATPSTLEQAFQEIWER